MLEINKIYNNDCIGENGMCLIDDKSVDCIICDLPYGTTMAKWDKIINQELLWKEYRRIIKEKGAIVLTSSQPFSSLLVYKNNDIYKHSWIWEKNNSADYANANCRPMKIHEDILVFSFASDVAPGKIKMKYNPQDLIVCNKINKRGRNSETTGHFNENEYIQKYTNYPRTILKYDLDKKKIHSTQKPVALFEYLIKTYTDEGDLVLDNCMGSFTTAVACINTNRNFIGFELDKKYYDLGQKRLEDLNNY